MYYCALYDIYLGIYIHHVLPDTLLLLVALLSLIIPHRRPLDISFLEQQTPLPLIELSS